MGKAQNRNGHENRRYVVESHQQSESSDMSAIGAQAIFDSLANQNEEEIGIEDFMERLSDFGHSDQDILRLFEFMDADNSSTIDRAEFINGYKQYARSTGSHLGQEWRLWNQLDQRDEEDAKTLTKAV